MTVTSFYFLLLLIIGVTIYYIVPKKIQWVILLILSLIFYYFSAVPHTITFLIISTGVAYLSTNLFCCERINRSDRKKRVIPWIVFIGIAINIVIWFILKGNSFWSTGIYALRKIVPMLKVPPLDHPFIPALGMGYYTAQVIGYIIDCYWGIIKPQKNPLKLFLFVCFFPQLTVGPISKYSQLQGLYESHKFNCDNLCLGSQRILWGFFKKLVISGRVAIIVNAIWANTEKYTGFWPWIAVFLYPLEIYSDFSGCVDIVLGVAELFDIRLPENFNNPFLARTIQEFWQRWHISLGIWAKDYIYYPVLKSKFLTSLGRWSKKHFNKRIAKFVPWAFGIGVLWFVMGFWHGSVKHIIGVSAWYWCTLVLGELLNPALKKVTYFLNINTQSFSWQLFQRIRTYIIYSLGAVFFAAEGLPVAVKQYQTLFRSLRYLNPWIFFNGEVLELGVTWADINLIIFGCYLLSKVSYFRENYGYARRWIQVQLLPFRWLIWIVLFLLVLIYGLYGPGYDASQFIYQGF